MYSRSGPSTLGKYAQAYSLLRDVKAGTLRQYQIVATLYERWAGGPVLLEQLDETSVSEWLRDYGQTAAPATVRGKKAMLLALWRAAADDGLCDPPTRRIRSIRRSAPRPLVEAWTLAEVEQLVAACRGLPRRHRCGLPRRQWWDLAVRVAWDSGLRWGDLVNLPVARVRPDGTTTIIQAKTGRPVSFVLSPGTLEALRVSLAACPRLLVCPWPASQETFTAQVRVLVRRAGIRAGTWKWLRRASGTDVEVQRPGAGSVHLGHAPGSRVFAESYGDPEIIGRLLPGPRPLWFDQNRGYNPPPCGSKPATT
jgi:integrase